MAQIAQGVLVNDQEITEEIRIRKACQMIEIMWPGAGIGVAEQPLSVGSNQPDSMLLVTLKYQSPGGPVQDLCTEVSLYDLHRLCMQTSRGNAIWPEGTLGITSADQADPIPNRTHGRKFSFFIDLTPEDANMPLTDDYYLSLYIRLNRAGAVNTVPVQYRVFTHEAPITGTSALRYENKTFPTSTAPTTAEQDVSRYDYLLFPFLQIDGPAGQPLQRGWQQLRLSNGAQRAGHELFILPDMVDQRTQMNDDTVVLVPSNVTDGLTGVGLPAGASYKTAFQRFADFDFANMQQDENYVAMRYARLVEYVGDWERLFLTYQPEQRMVFRRPLIINSNGVIEGL